MLRAGLYVRLSDEDEGKLSAAEFSQSILNQQALLMDYAREHRLEVFDVYCDDDFSGLYDDRPGFARLLADARAGRFEVIIAKSQSRFSRNMEHIEHYLHREFVELGIRFIGVVDGVDTDLESNKKARQIYGLTNEWYSEDLSKNIRAVFQMKTRNGQFIGSFAPYGYQKDPQDKNHLVVDETAAAVVRRIFGLYLEGCSIEGICEILSREQISSPALYKRRQGLTYRQCESYRYCEQYGLWSETTVRRILKDQTYLGHLVQGKTVKKNYKSKQVEQVPKEQWVVVRDTHQAIISEADFTLVQQRFGKRSRREQGRPMLRPAAGMIRCARCQSPIVNCGRNKKGTRTYGRCQLSKKSRGAQCTAHKIVFEEVEALVSEQIGKLISAAWAQPALRRELLACRAGQRACPDSGREVRRYRMRIAEIKMMRKELYADKVNKRIAAQTFRELDEAFAEEAGQLQQRLEQADRSDAQETAERAEDGAELLAYLRAEEGLAERFRYFIDYIEIAESSAGDEQEVVIHWRI